MGDRDFERQLQGWSLTTAEIMYRMPDYRSVLQTYIWQDYDMAPKFPRLIRFLDFWSHNLEGPLASGVAADQPYDVILLEGRAEEIPAALLDQLADDGRLVAVVGETETAHACVYSKSNGAVAVRQVFDASVTALPGFRKKKPAFVF